MPNPSWITFSGGHSYVSCPARSSRCLPAWARVPEKRCSSRLWTQPEGQRFTADQHESTRGYGATHAPQSGIAPDLQAATHVSADLPKVTDRGVYHASDAMKDLYDMGDAPSCLTCGAIMVRNGSCYRCMSCGSTSGCS